MRLSACRAPTRAPSALVTALAAALTLAGCRAEERSVSLVVLVSVDQLRPEELERYDDLFRGGFRRLLDRGLYFPNAVHDHAHTETAPGHATLATGVHPARSGIVANAWWEQTDGAWRDVYSVEDAESPLVGAEGEGRSPRNLLRGGLADWMAGARIVSLSHKDRAAILLAGKARGHVYWFHDVSGRFVTSSHYSRALPGWLERFHRGVLAGLLADSTWESIVPPAAAGRTRSDTFPYEGDGAHTHFPHRFADEGATLSDGNFGRWVAFTPVIDQAVLELARAAVESLGLGRGDRVDYLGLGLCQADYVGHLYGPHSREQLDNLLRLDRALGALFELLDREVGPERYVVALSADHGVLPIPEYLQEQGSSARRVHPDEIRRAVERVRGEGADGVDPAALSAALAGLDAVADVVPHERLEDGAPGDSFLELFRRSHHPERVAGPLGRYGFAVRFADSVLVSSDPRGTSHGSPYLYDRRVPIILMGPGVEAGRSTARARTVDVAPTLAEWAGIPYPEDLDGRSLLHVRAGEN